MAGVGETAPGFSLSNQDGAQVSLSDQAGKYVLIWWYPKADTPGWTIEGKGFRDRIQDFQSNEVVVMGCSFDAPGDNKAFKDKFDFPFDLLSDTDKSMSIAYGAANDESPRPTRISVLIGPDGKVVRRFDTVKPAEHPEEVLEALAHL